MITNGAQPNAILDIQSDALGEWQANLPTDLQDGLHTVVVTDETGTMQDVAFFSVSTREKVNFIDRTKEVPSSWFIYFIFFFLVVILILAGNNLRLAWIKKRMKVKEVDSIKRYSVILSIISVVSSLLVGGLLAVYLLGIINDTDIVDTGAGKELVVPKFNINRLSGAVIDPSTNELVKDVSIAHREVEISTKDGGNFTFSNVESGDLLEIMHQSLLVPVFYKVSKDKQYLDIYFDTDLYQKLISILQAEADSNISYIYSNLAEQVKDKVDVTTYIESYQKLYVQDVDSVVISDMMQKTDWVSESGIQYPKVLAVEVTRSGKSKIYTFVEENLDWKLVE